MINFVKFWKLGNIFSLFLIILSIFLLFTKELNYGIDFTGGVLIEIASNSEIRKENIFSISQKFNEKSIKHVLQKDGINGLIIKLQSFDSTQQEVIEKSKSIINSEFSPVEYGKIDFIGAQISKEFFSKSCMALGIALLGIMIYLLVRFDLRFAIAGIIGLAHDVIITLGFIAFFKIEINMITVTALLTIIGYSINDSVIIFDRIREIFNLHNDHSTRENINLALNNTLKRTLFTSLTTLFSAGALIIFGGANLHSFSYVVFFGILIGTYSSIFIASQMIDLLPNIKNKTITNRKNIYQNE
jgi:preprotein translocase subunit SecF